MKYTLWINYGTDEWSPEDYNSLEDLIFRIKQGNLYSGFRITKELELKIGDENEK